MHFQVIVLTGRSSVTLHLYLKLARSSIEYVRGSGKMTNIAELTEAGKEFGLEGEELQKWVEAQLQHERDEQQKDRELQLELTHIGIEMGLQGIELQKWVDKRLHCEEYEAEMRQVADAIVKCQPKTTQVKLQLQPNDLQSNGQDQTVATKVRRIDGENDISTFPIELCLLFDPVTITQEQSHDCFVDPIAMLDDVDVIPVSGSHGSIVVTNSSPDDDACRVSNSRSHHGHRPLKRVGARRVSVSSEVHQTAPYTKTGNHKMARINRNGTNRRTFCVKYKSTNNTRATTGGWYFEDGYLYRHRPPSDGATTRRRRLKTCTVPGRDSTRAPPDKMFHMAPADASIQATNNGFIIPQRRIPNETSDLLIIMLFCIIQ